MCNKHNSPHADALFVFDFTTATANRNYANQDLIAKTERGVKQSGRLQCERNPSLTIQQLPVIVC